MLRGQVIPTAGASPGLVHADPDSSRSCPCARCAPTLGGVPNTLHTTPARLQPGGFL